MTISVRIAVLILFLTAFSMEAQSASFDCGKAKSRAEMIICSDSELSALDDALAKTYAKAKSVAPSPVEFKAQSEREWKRRETTCFDKQCLLAWYSQRRGQLLSIINAQSPGAQPLPPPPSKGNETVSLTQELPKTPEKKVAPFPDDGKQKTYKVMAAGYFGCTDKEKFKRLRDILMKGDDTVFLKEMNMSVKKGECVTLPQGEKVALEETAAMSGMIKIRKAGGASSFWTTTNAVGKKPE